jgi:hypothetical protein
MSKCAFFLSYINFRVRFILPTAPFMVTDELQGSIRGQTRPVRLGLAMWRGEVGWGPTNLGSKPVVGEEVRCSIQRMR